MGIRITVPEKEDDLKPRIVVFAAGGAGGNAINNMISAELQGVEFWVANTDAQSLSKSLCQNRIQLGVKCTKGLGAGSYPEVGKQAAEESIEDIRQAVSGANMVFIAAGMGGGTGTGSMPVIAQIAKDEGALVVGVVTKPFSFEGPRRMDIAEAGIKEIEKCVDTLVVVPNENLFRIANEQTSFIDAFKLADNVLYSGVRSITDLITMTGLINLDFADVKAIMSGRGKAMMGTGEAEGTDRAIKAAEAAISNPLLDSSSMKGAKGVLINITGGDMTLYEVTDAANRVREEVTSGTNVIFGSVLNTDLKGKIRVSVVATGIDCKDTDFDLNNTKDTKNIKDTKGTEVINLQIDEIQMAINQDNKDLNSFRNIGEFSDIKLETREIEDSIKGIKKFSTNETHKIKREFDPIPKRPDDDALEIPAFLRKKNSSSK